MVTTIRGYGYTRPTFARELLHARERIDLSGLVGMAMRSHRRELGLPQRAYALMRGWSKTRQARLEACAEALKMGTVRQALEGTGFRLALVHDGPPFEHACGAQSPAADSADTSRPSTVCVEEATVLQFIDSELIARDAADRRFPAGRSVRRTRNPPKWWVDRYATRGAVEPEWSTVSHVPRA